MHKFKTRFFLLALLFLLGGPALAEVNPQAAAEAPKRFYQAVNSKDFATAWGLLTEESKSRIVALVAQDAKMQIPEVRSLFDATAPPVVDGFWDSFRTTAKPDLYTGFTYTFTGENNGAYIITISQPGSTTGKPAELIVKDEGGYKFGLIESNPPGQAPPPGAN